LTWTELNFKSTNVFFRQIRNMVFDTTDVPGKVDALHWPSSQATSIQNCVFKLSTRPEDNHVGIFMEEGSGGIMTDLVFHGGKTGASFGNQQYTMRNLTFYNQDVAIDQLWNWGWTYKNLHIHDCKVGINMSSPSVGSVILMESTFNNVGTAIITGRAPGSANGAGSLVIENVIYTNVNTVIEGPGGHALLAGSPHGVLVEPGYLRVSCLRHISRFDTSFSDMHVMCRVISMPRTGRSPQKTATPTGFNSILPSSKRASFTSDPNRNTNPFQFPISCQPVITEPEAMVLPTTPLP